MRLRSGSLPWLLRHELGLAWRDYGGRRRKLMLVVYGIAFVALHALIVPLFGALDAFDEAASTPRTAALREGVWQSSSVFLAALLWITLTVMLAQAITRSVDVLFDRGDLDLLLASPLPPRHVFVARGLGVALTCVAIYALLLTPIAHIGLVYGRPRLLAIYPALAAFGLLAAALGMTLTLALVRLLGARRARVAAQLLGAFVGAAFFLLTQAGNWLSQQRTSRWLIEHASAARQHAATDHLSLLSLPLDAMRGRPAALLVLVLAGAGLFTVVVATLAPLFLAGTRESLAAERSRRPQAAAPARFRTGLAVGVLTKEWKLIGRDPQLIAQTLLQTLYLLPIVFLPQLRGGSTLALIGPAVVVTAALLTSGLAWLTVAAEDAPDLIGAAPVDPGALRRFKLAAAVLPTWILVTPFIGYSLLTRPAAAAVFAFCIAGATLAAGAIQVAMPWPGARRDLRQRARGNPIGSLLETLSAFGWAALAWSLVAAPSYAPLAAVPALAASGAAWALGTSRRRALLQGRGG